MILNYPSKREKKKLIDFSERKNNQDLKAVHPLQDGSNATEDILQGYKPARIEGKSETDTQSLNSPIPERKENAEFYLIRMMIVMTSTIR